MPSAHALGLGDVRLKLTRPISPPKWLFRGFGDYPFRERVSFLQPPACAPIGVYPTPLRFGDGAASRWYAHAKIIVLNIKILELVKHTA
jgi:hypothetical protein